MGDRVAPLLPLAPGWKGTRSFDGDAFTAGMSKLQPHWRKQQRNQAIEAEIERLAAELSDGSDTIEGERLQLLLNRAADWAAHYYVGMPFQASCDMEQIIRKIEQEYPAFCAKHDRL